jgi:hypothetical protein
MKWPKKLKAGGSYVRLIIGERRMVQPNTSQYYLGEFRESLKELEVSEGEDTIDIFLHEIVHVIQYMMGDYMEPDRDNDKGNEDRIAQAVRAFLLDNADFVRDLLDEIESPGGASE